MLRWNKAQAKRWVRAKKQAKASKQARAKKQAKAKALNESASSTVKVRENLITKLQT
jgi:hypothetical protein